MAHQQSPYEKIEKIQEVSEAKSPALDYENFEPETRLPPNQQHFEALLNPVDADVGDVRKIQTAKNSVVEEVASVGRLVDQAKHSNPKQLIAQAQEAIGKIEELKQKLNTPNLELKTSVQQELRSKLSHIDDNLRIAMNRSGIEYTPPPSGKPANAIERFLGLLTDSQDKLDHLTTDIQKLDNKGTPFTPATMIVLQLKVGAMQQQIEFFTTLLNKALESTKTIMNVQV